MKFILRHVSAGFLFGIGMWGGWYFGQACYWLGQQLRMRGMF